MRSTDEKYIEALELIKERYEKDIKMQEELTRLVDEIATLIEDLKKGGR